MKFRTDINAMRALAVTLVVLHHFKIKGFSAGFVGVDIFFVLSGYLMTSNIVGGLLANRFNLFKFLMARAARIWPALLVMVLSLLALGAFLLPARDHQPLLRMAGGALFFYSNVLHREANYFSTSLDERWLLHTWSLSVEWQFYCLYPVYLQLGTWGINKLFPGTRGKHAAIAWLVAGLALASFGLCIFSVIHQKSTFFSTSARIWEMQIGGMAFLLFKRFPHMKWGGVELVLKTLPAFLLASCMYLGRGGRWEVLWPNALTLVPVLAAALYIARPTQNRPLAFIERSALVTRLGQWSYSIYLFHWPIVVGMNFYFMEQGGAPLIWRMLGIAASVALGFLSFTFIESRFKYQASKPLPKLLSMETFKFAGVLSSMVAVLLCSTFNAGAAGKGNEGGHAITPACENYQVRAADAKACFTQSGKSDVIVFGDSHAAHFFPWFKVRREKSAAFFVSNGCYPFFGFNRPDPGFDCIGIQRKFMEMISSGDYKTVIISGNWRKGDADDYLGDRERLVAIENTAKAFDEIVEKGMRLIVVKPTPFAGLSMANLQPRYALWGRTPPTSFLDKDHATAVGDQFLADVQKAMKYPAALNFVDLRPLFCSEDVCDLTDRASNYPIFFDDNHLSERWIIEHGDQVFSRIL